MGFRDVSQTAEVTFKVTFKEKFIIHNLVFNTNNGSLEVPTSAIRKKERGPKF